MEPVLVLRHGADIPAGYLGDVLADAGAPVVTASLHAGSAVPDHLDWSAVVSLGGEMGAYQEDRYPYLAAEKAFLRKAADAGLPVLGVCLGCQLLADALGGRAYRAPLVEMGVLTPELTPAGAADPVIGRLDGPVLIWHQDTWETPPGAELLARTDRHPMAFRRGSVVAMQPHPEVSPEILAGWLEIAPARHFEEAGMTPAELLAAVEGQREEGEALARRLFGAWVEEALG